MLIKPQLAENLPTEKLASYSTKENWWFEQKFDGHRLLMHVIDGEAQPINRRGHLIEVSPKIRADFEAGLFDRGEWVFDGELLRDTYVVFDLLAVPGKLDISTPYRQRRSLLDNIYGVWQPHSVIVNGIAKTSGEKRALLRKTIVQRSEGVMLKQNNAPYFPGRRAGMAVLKCKFVKTADVIVTIVGREGKNSVAIAVYNDNGELVDVGACTVTPRVLSELDEYNVIEVRYLYATEKDKLFQPAFMGVRWDKSPEECTIDQLIYTNKGVVSFEGQERA